MYSIWLLPHTDKHKELAQLMLNLGRERDGPCFSPHITLFAGVHGSEKELITKTSELATKMKVLSVKTSTVETQDSFYKSLYLKIVETRSLLDSRQHAETLFHPLMLDETEDLKHANDFMPHLSLLYGSQSEQLKKQIIASLKDKTRLDLLIDRVALVSTQGPPENWTMVSVERLF